MDSTIVIKVKYAKTLRRFNARVLNNGLEFNLDGLRNKIRGLFNFSSDDDLVLTYVDEDNDKITFGDDEDLRDVVRQSLNPLRISVSLRTDDNVARTPNGSERVIRTPDGSESVRTPDGSESVTTFGSSQVQNPFENLNSAVIEFISSLPEPLSKRVISSLPEPLSRGVMKMLSDLASTGTSPGLSEVVQFLLEKSFSSPRQPSESGVATGSSVLASAPVTEKALKLAGAQEAGSSNVQKSEPEHLPNEKHEKKLPSKTGVSIVISNPEAITEAQSAPKSHEILKDQVTETNEVVKSGGSKESAVKTPGQKAEKEALKEKAISEENGYVGKAAKASPVVGSPTISYPTLSSKKNDFQQPNMPQVPKPIEVDDPCGKAKKLPWFASSSMPNSIPLVNTDSFKKPMLPPVSKPVQGFPFPSAPGFQTWNKGQPNTFNYPSSPAPQCPFLGTSIGNNPAGPYSRRNYGYCDGSGTIFHRGVRCDGCGVHPITGTRYKSIVKDDYDLCRICFSQMGVESDYMRIDRPVTYHNPSPFPPRVYHAPQPSIPDSYSANLIRPKLDSRFIQDVTILDGTLMAPSTPFTKIWRMRNNGSLHWQWGTKLIWIGGDKMGDVFSVDLEIPGGTGSGFPVDQELDVAVKFIAPDRPGRYVSYWRMRSPTGQKFGQRVWVLIQVDATVTEVQQALRDFNLNNMPSNTPGGSATEVLDDAEPLEDNAADLVKAVFDLSSEKKDDLIFPINDNLLVGGGSGSGSGSGWLTAQPPSSSASPPVSYPMIDLSDHFPSRPSGGTFVAPPFNDESDQTTEIAPPAQKSSTEVSDLDPVAANAHEVSDPVIVAVTAPAAPAAPTAPELLVVAANDHMVPAEGEEENELEKNLLMYLDRMGFKEVDLNKEILRSNKYDMEKSVNDLCGESEWDPILEELHEMGFHDDVMNKKLLEKNKGSVTQVVLDLLVEE